MAEFDTTLPPLTDLVDGELIPTATDDSAGVEDPNTGQRLQPMGVTADDTLEAALVAADRVHRDGSWSGLSPDERATWLDAWPTPWRNAPPSPPAAKP
jgi:acyl-CoA reductase-like NAD-dependent aldehyde dehydrogenase